MKVNDVFNFFWISDETGIATTDDMGLDFDFEVNLYPDGAIVTMFDDGAHEEPVFGIKINLTYEQVAALPDWDEEKPFPKELWDEAKRLAPELEKMNEEYIEKCYKNAIMCGSCESL